MKQDFDYSFAVHALRGDETCECCETAPARVRLIGGGAWCDLCPNCAEQARQKLESDYAATMDELAHGKPRRAREVDMSGKKKRGKCGQCAHAVPGPSSTELTHVVCHEPGSKSFCCILSRDHGGCKVYERRASAAEGEAADV